MPEPTVLLDLDGTLLDSATGITEHLSSAIASVITTVHEPATLRAHVGPPFEVVMPQLGLEPHQVLAAIREYRRTYDPLATSLSQPYPGILELLDRLRGCGIRLAVATSKPESLARTIVSGNGLEDYFATVGGADVTVGRSGKAAVVGSVLGRLEGVEPTCTLMVGDRRHDVEGAAAHGLATIGVSWGYAEPGELMTAGAVSVVENPQELGELLVGHFGCR